MISFEHSSKLIAYSIIFFAVRVANSKRIFEEILAHFAAALENVYCSRSVSLIPFTVTSPTKRLKWRRNPQGLASCGRNERTEGLSPLNSPLNDSHKYQG